MLIENYEHLGLANHESNLKYVLFSLLKGKEISPRGLLCKELENYSFSLSPYVRFFNFESRKLNISYIKQEFLWYLRGNRYDLSICKYAKLWKDIIALDRGINSNYGQYIFGDENQFDNIVHILEKDKDSRRAVITILNSKYLLNENEKDVPCTCYLSFRIRNNTLNMTVRMRSQDAIYGAGSDIPIFSFIHEMLYETLKETYPDLIYGDYYHSADSFHVYAKHFEMLDKICGNDIYKLVLCPKISNRTEVKFLRNLHKNIGQEIPSEFKFTKWLMED